MLTTVIQNAKVKPRSPPSGSQQSLTWGQSKPRGVCLWSLFPSKPSIPSPSGSPSTFPHQEPPLKTTVAETVSMGWMDGWLDDM